MRILACITTVLLLQACSSTPKYKLPTEQEQRQSYNQSVIDVLEKQKQKNILITHWTTIRNDFQDQCLKDLREHGYFLNMRYRYDENKTFVRLQKPLVYKADRLVTAVNSGNQLIKNCQTSSDRYEVDYVTNQGEKSTLSLSVYPISARRDGMESSCEVEFSMNQAGLVEQVYDIDCGKVTRIFAKAALKKVAKMFTPPDLAQPGKKRSTTLDFKLTKFN